jgi:hypothetical protein
MRLILRRGAGRFQLFQLGLMELVKRHLSTAPRTRGQLNNVGDLTENFHTMSTAFRESLHELCTARSDSCVILLLSRNLLGHIAAGVQHLGAPRSLCNLVNGPT